MKDAIKKVFDFATYVEGFKKMERFKGMFFWRDYPYPERYESNADHTWRMAMILIILEPHLSKPIDFKRAVKMALIHDVPELIAGDASPLGSDGTGNDSHAYNKQIAQQKFEEEKKAARDIFNKLPKESSDELYKLWLEFEEQASFEAKLVKAIDKFEGKLQSLEYTRGCVHKDHLAFALTYGVRAFEVDPAMKALGDLVLRETEGQFKEFTAPRSLEESS